MLSMSVIMSDMKAAAIPVFTIRDMNRNTLAVMNACRLHGQVIIRGRSGECFKVEPFEPESSVSEPSPAFVERLKQHRKRVQALGFGRPKSADLKRLNRLIAGEE